MNSSDMISMNGTAYLEFKRRFECHNDLVEALRLANSLIIDAIESNTLHKDHLDIVQVANAALLKSEAKTGVYTSITSPELIRCKPSKVL